MKAILRNAGFRPCRLVQSVRGWFRYRRERQVFRSLPGGGDWPWGRELPILTEYGEAAGHLGAYFYQDQWVAGLVHDQAPRRHVDVGSRLDGFVGMLSVFRDVEVIDIRPAPGCVRRVKFHQLDIMERLPEQWVGCTDSLSCLHTVEHFGLGRYGDPLDPMGHLKGVQQLKRMLEPGGHLYLSVPVGPERIEFNAHRVFSPSSVFRWFDDGWEIEGFWVLDDSNRLHEYLNPEEPPKLDGMDCELGVGMIKVRNCG